MPLRAGNAGGGLPDSAILGAIEYACANGARVVNGSFGGDRVLPGDLRRDHVARRARTRCSSSRRGTAASTASATTTTRLPQYPCNYATTRIVCVAATDQNDAQGELLELRRDERRPRRARGRDLQHDPDVRERRQRTASRTRRRSSARAGASRSRRPAIRSGGSRTPAPRARSRSATRRRATTRRTPTRRSARSPGANLTGRAGCSLGYSMHLETQPGDVFSI